MEQALKEEGEGRTPEKLDKGPNKTERATEIMKEMWDDLQAGKVKRKDVIKRFIEEVGLTAIFARQIPRHILRHRI
ncbi:MAG: hypothetical protein GY794_00195 [bacterium]|nr:hypothetical protein [bacterium]